MTSDTKKESAVPSKLVYKLEEVSHLTKIDPAVIESWEKEFYFIQSGFTGSGKKIFRKQDLAIILRLKELIENQSLTLAGAKRRIEEEFGIKRSVPVNPDRLRKMLTQIREQLKDISHSLD